MALVFGWGEVEGLQLLDQVLVGEGFGEKALEIVDTSRVSHAQAAHGDDRDLRANSAQQGQGGEAVHAGHHQVEENGGDVSVVFGEEGEGADGIVGDYDLVVVNV